MERRFVPLVVSGVVLTLGLTLLAPLAISLLYADGSWESFLVPSAAMISLGGLGFRATLPPSPGALAYVHPRDVLLSVTLVWVIAALLGGYRTFWRVSSPAP